MEEISKNQIIEVLSKIIDLSRGKDIYTSGNVTDISIKDNNVQVTLEVESHRAKAFEVIRKEVEKAINKIPKVANGIVILTSHAVKPLSKSINETVDKKDNKKSIVVESNIKTFIALGSGKGGVGKSTTAANIAVGLSLEGFSVGLLDADIYGPSQPRMLGISGRPRAVHGDLIAPMKNHGISMMSM